MAKEQYKYSGLDFSATAYKNLQKLRTNTYFGKKDYYNLRQDNQLPLANPERQRRKLGKAWKGSPQT